MQAPDLPLITICIPIYRRTKYMRGCIESCLAQTAQNFEVIVHDDTEDDSIRSIVESFASPKIRYIHNDPPLGMLGKVNDFQNVVRGEWMVYLCDDDLLEPGYIEAVTRHVQAHPDASLIRCRQRLLFENGEEFRLDAASPVRSSPAEFIVQMFRHDPKTIRTNLTGVAFTKTALRTVGDDIFNMRHSDRIIYAKIAVRGDVFCDEAVLVNLRTHEGSISGKLDPDYWKAFSEALALKSVMDGVFATLRAKAASPEDLAIVEEGVRQFGGYLTRSLQRAVDNGLLALLQTRRGSLRKDFAEATALLKRHQVPRFQSLWVYEMAMNLPFALRSAGMDAFRRQKVRKRSSR